MNTDIRILLQGVQDGSVSVDEALLQLKQQPFADLGYAKVDLHRPVRQGTNEVIYGAGKTPEQIIGILQAMAKNGQKNVLITRLDKEKADEISKTVAITYYETAKVAIAGQMAAPSGMGKIVVATGGTSDI
ncbi:MAG: 1-(5-phosphoribosyl)-5-amino-4-imidazole-carboxylate carboxylase, partial [Oscillospiraceae bacterium]|nr:1-(5-phosphoribosyl)-5-amino-4-imidazole-carboxylate carboxylase [Oscillospiraceae bacterium]